MFQDSGVLQAGIHIMPGLPRVVSARLQDNSAEGAAASSAAPYLQAFIINANEKLQITASLILPAGWFRPQGAVELFDNGQIRELRLTQLINRGPNFEQVSFTDAASA
ncbi:hypothetical protein AGMMS50243_28350 [Betaproteobacteria bacterium]|nr:hypothetical protein AGMMS50243_28350 [Betaproteobacteria bacterium]